MTHPREALKEIFHAALAAVDPYGAVIRHTGSVRDSYETGRFKRLYVVGFGKAAPLMVRALSDQLGDLITGGLAITKYGHSIEGNRVESIELFEAGHPLPDRNGVEATRRAVELARTFDAATMVVCLISGGGSALFVAPCPGISLREKRECTDLLLKAGADIGELNGVRKHVSSVKGGRLAQLAHPATIKSLVLSDVIDDRLDVIASGPTAPDATTFADALEVIEKYGIESALPLSVVKHLKDGEAGFFSETPKADSAVFARVENIIVGGNDQAIDAARMKCFELGFKCVVIARGLKGEAAGAGRELAREATSAWNERKLGSERDAPLCLISGGETTVTVKGNGVGGRNTELALSFALPVQGISRITLLSAGTDGTDGPTDAAGAFADGGTITRGRDAGLEGEACLENNDSYTFFAGTDDLFTTGPTGTNVMDLQLVLIGGEEG